MAQAKVSSLFFCQDCGQEHKKWVGQCSGCGAWNRLTEAPKPAKVSGYAGEVVLSDPIPLTEVSCVDYERISSGQSELDRALGGGLVPGAVILLGGDPGVGKSTLLLQTL